MSDAFDEARRARLVEINKDPKSRESLEVAHGQVWDTQELMRDFEVIGFLAPVVVVKRRADHMKGSLFFQHNPRFYFDFVVDGPG